MADFCEEYQALVADVDAWTDVAMAVVDRLREPGWTALAGDLGSGKTTFVQALAAVLGVPTALSVTSPTYEICHRYESIPELLHFDLYRLQAESELADADWDPAAFVDRIVLVEWAERFPFTAHPPARIMQFGWQDRGRRVRLLVRANR